MAKYLVETYYNCTFKVSHYLDEINDSELKKLEKRDDGDFEIIDVKLDNRKTKNLDKSKKITEISTNDSSKVELISEIKSISINNNLVNKLVEKMIELGSNLIGLGARDTLRLEAGLCLYGHDINEETSPLEANLKWAISKNRINDEFTGAKEIKRQFDEGVKKLRVGIKPESRVIARESTKIFDEKNNQIGKITSGTYGPSVNGPIAMGYVSNLFSKSNTRVFLEVRGKKIPASICDLPFYKKNYVKGEVDVRS